MTIVMHPAAGGGGAYWMVRTLVPKSASAAATVIANIEPLPICSTIRSMFRIDTGLVDIQLRMSYVWAACAVCTKLVVPWA